MSNTGRFENELNRIGARDANRELYRDRQARKRTKNPTWQFRSVSGNSGATTNRRDAK